MFGVPIGECEWVKYNIGLILMLASYSYKFHCGQQNENFTRIASTLSELLNKLLRVIIYHIGLDVHIHHIYCATANLSPQSVSIWRLKTLCSTRTYECVVSDSLNLLYAKRHIIITMMTKSGIEFKFVGENIAAALRRHEQQKLTTLRSGLQTVALWIVYSLRI